jgi:hypothetical protein
MWKWQYKEGSGMLEPILIRRQKTRVEKKGGVCESDDWKPCSNPSKDESESAHAEGSNKQRACEEDTFPRVASSLLIDPANHPKFVALRLVQEMEKKKGREGTPTLPIQELTDSSSRSYDSDDNNTMNTAEY